MNTEEILDNKISIMLKNSDALPRAPEELVDRTVKRMTAIERGLKAEEKLSELGNDPDAVQREEIYTLAAESSIGRMAQHRELKTYLPGKDNIAILAQDEIFRKAVGSKDPEALLGDIRSGKLAEKVTKEVKKPEELNNEFNRQKSRIKEHKPMTM